VRRRPGSARRDPGSARRGDVARRLPHPRGGLVRRLAPERRQPVDEGPELVFAEEPHDRDAVVDAELRRIEVQLHRDVADEPLELAALQHALSCLEEEWAEPLGGHLVEPLVESVQGAEGRDQLGGGLLPHAGDAGDVVRGVALEGLVVEHLVGP